ncbi:nuclear transport factor 2 family protein [Microbispora sp. NPDC046973]|uniref:nuclear transport factor 2 family protein n=1 Tax=Streptosporangiaceae TaxID=2004 RepID=UPI001BDC9CF8|nr:nuclear transport factor 2 family protein [Sphaerisporangium fuscum]
MLETTETERNRKLVLEGFARFARGDIAVLRTLLAEDFVEHSPGNPSGRDAFIDFIAHAPVAGARLELKRAIADGQYVVVHYLMIPPGEERGTAVVDIWRLEDGLIVEHWDVVQPVPEPAEIPNGMF